ncbi:hypothetical protein [Conexibacter sp. CPCC 206217]|uniref:hypothetical protein n=1 Tax=Conexibacter sp. CPCC 206217 TaxID=3064574 RepID=UPI00271AFA8E|nr:hypothetical protein [Conexibacter sp. CPCC 206217]MDO8212908.1 hypothetical protein [Conexibacter sp. CPCC 206217]
MGLLAGCRAGGAAIVAVAVVTSLIPCAVAPAATPTAVLTVDGDLYDVSGRPDEWLHGPGGPLGTAVAVARFPFSGSVLYSEPPTSVDARLLDRSFKRVPGAAVSVRQIDDLVWDVGVARAVPDETKVWLVAHYAEPSDGVNFAQTSVFRLIWQDDLQFVGPRAPAPTVELTQVRRRGARIVLQVRTNITGVVTGSVRQAGSTHSFSRGGMVAGTHRFFAYVPRPRTRVATVTVRLTDLADRSASAVRTLR